MKKTILLQGLALAALVAFSVTPVAAAVKVGGAPPTGTCRPPADCLPAIPPVQPPPVCRPPADCLPAIPPVGSPALPALPLQPSIGGPVPLDPNPATGVQ